VLHLIQQKVMSAEKLVDVLYRRSGVLGLSGISSDFREILASDANEGRDTRSLQLYLGHRNIQHTVRYTELAAGRFNGWFAD
jgi:acetate kinase